MESENLNNMLEKFEDNLSIISCDIDKITTLSKLLNKILSDNTDFEQKDSLNVCSLLVQELHVLNQRMRELESFVQEQNFSCK
ncbi:MAG: hypothetical protein ACLSWI_00345 [Candidatus Gastranaerophilaceae bacterium]